ncbi:MAG: HAMP domain-containing histidine kinase [Promicromonosporaceae bacterium]|nr:HAMP domain-containing histidine kinase [Promicromonosporaceae bacterium]
MRILIAGGEIDIRDHREGDWAALKNDIHALVRSKGGESKYSTDQKEVMERALVDIAHQIKTPLTGAMLMLDLLDQATDSQRPELPQQLSIALNRIDWLTTSLLNLARLEEKLVEFHSQNTTTGAVITQARVATEPLLAANQQRLVIVGESLPLTTDLRWSGEALANVFKNAVEHSPPGSAIKIAGSTNALYTAIAVTDSGPGISRDALPHLFQRFTGSRSERGFGIGLPLALAIMRGQRGDVTVDGGRHDDGGRGNQGATFTLKFYHSTSITEETVRFP